MAKKRIVDATDPTGTGLVAKATTSGKRKPVERKRREIVLPVYDEDGIVFRLTQHVLDLRDKDGEEVASVGAGSGLGGDFIVLQAGERRAVAYMRDILRLWVALDDPEMAENMPEAKIDG